MKMKEQQCLFLFGGFRKLSGRVISSQLRILKSLSQAYRNMHWIKSEKEVKISRSLNRTDNEPFMHLLVLKIWTTKLFGIGWGAERYNPGSEKSQHRPKSKFSRSIFSMHELFGTLKVQRLLKQIQSLQRMLTNQQLKILL